MDDVDLIALGDRLRALRTERGMSLSALAAEAGVGKGSLSELESGHRNPTLATLYALAGPLGVPLGVLLAERPGTQVSGDGLTVTLLGSEHQPGPQIVEVFRLDFAPGADRRSAAEHPGTREHLLVTTGRLELTHRDGRAQLGPGDSLTFRSDAPHRYRALDAASASAVLVITSPTNS